MTIIDKFGRKYPDAPKAVLKQYKSPQLAWCKCNWFKAIG